MLDTLSPAERLAFVLHDLFAVPFDEIAPIVDRTPRSGSAARQPGASPCAWRRPRRPTPTDRPGEIVEAFLAAARNGDFDALVGCSTPMSSCAPGLARVSDPVRSADAVARTHDVLPSGFDHRPALVNGAAGTVSPSCGLPFAIAAFTDRGGAIAAIDFLADPDRHRPSRPHRLDPTVLDPTALGN